MPARPAPPPGRRKAQRDEAADEASKKSRMVAPYRRCIGFICVIPSARRYGSTHIRRRLRCDLFRRSNSAVLPSRSNSARRGALEVEQDLAPVGAAHQALRPGHRHLAGAARHLVDPVQHGRRIGDRRRRPAACRRPRRRRCPSPARRRRSPRARTGTPSPRRRSASGRRPSRRCPCGCRTPCPACSGRRAAGRSAAACTAAAKTPLARERGDDRAPAPLGAPARLRAARSS